jgi:hypothetical protein
MFIQAVLGIPLWLLIFILVSAILIIPAAALVQSLITIVVLGALGYGAGYFYFKKRPGDIRAGAILGVIWAVVVAVFDWLTIGVASLVGQSDFSVRGFYSSWEWYVALAALIVGTALAGFTVHGGALMKKSAASPFTPPPKSAPATPAKPPTPTRQPKI